MDDTKYRAPAVRILVGALLLATLTTTSAGLARAWELIPAIGVTKSTDENAGDAKAFGGLAVRVPVLPFLKLEGGIAYRQDAFADGDLKVRQWPVTASAWLAPLPMVYAGGGVGWYRTTMDFREELPFEDSTTQKMGVHVGGGVDVPMTPTLGLDLHGRYIFMQADDELEVPTTFDPDYWTLALGLAFKF